MNRILGLSLVGFREREAIQAHQEQFPSLQWELSYKMSEQFLSDVEPIIADRVVSVHACCPAEPLFPNFGSRDKTVLDESFKALKRPLKTARDSERRSSFSIPGMFRCQDPRFNAEREALLTGSSFAPMSGWRGIDLPGGLPEKRGVSTAFRAGKGIACHIKCDGRRSGTSARGGEPESPGCVLVQTPAEMVSLANARMTCSCALMSAICGLPARSMFDYLEESNRFSRQKSHDGSHPFKPLRSRNTGVCRLARQHRSTLLRLPRCFEIAF